MSAARSLCIAALVIVFFGAAWCAAESRPATDAAGVSLSDTAESTKLPPEPLWLTITGLCVMGAGAVVLLVWFAIKRRRAFELPAIPKKQVRRITGVQVLAGVCIWLLLSLLFSQMAMTAMGVSKIDDATALQAVILCSAGPAGQQVAVVVILWMLWKGSKVSPSDLGIRADRLGRSLVTGFLVLLAVYPLCYGVYFATDAVLRYAGHPPKPHPILMLVIKYKLMWLTHSFTVIAAFVVPVLEEVFFRGFLQTFFRQHLRNRHMAIVLGAAAFAVAHLGAWESIPAMFVLGLGLGFAYEKTGSLAAPILGHMLFNGMTMLRFY